MELGPLLQKIDALKVEIDSLRPLKAEQEARIEKKFRLEWNHHSTALEGNKVTLGETEIFLEYGLTARGKPLKDYLDIRGHDQAILCLREVVRRNEPLTEAFVRELHKILLQESYTVNAITPDGAPTTKEVRLGEYKTLPNHVKTPTGEIHYYAKPEETSAKMGELMSWVHQELENKRLHPIVIAAVFHHRFVAIHPFDDGNGRMARLLMNLILMRNEFPPVVIRTEERDEYIFALRSADGGDPDLFVDFIAKGLVWSLELLLRGAKGEAVEEPDDIDKEIGLLKQELKHIEEPLELSQESKEAVFAESISPLIAKLISKLAQIDELFATHRVSVTGQLRRAGSVHHWPPSGEVMDTITSVRRFAEAQGTAINLGINFSWSDFKKNPLHKLSLQTDISVRFERLRYLVQVSGMAQKIFLYSHTLNADEIQEIIATVCRPVLSGVRQAIQKSSG